MAAFVPVVHLKILWRYLFWPLCQLAALLVATRWYLITYPDLKADMVSNLVEALWAAALVWGFTVVRDLYDESIPVLRRAWIFKGCRQINVVHADAVGCVVGIDQTGIPRVNLTNVPVPVNGVQYRLAAWCEKPPSLVPRPVGGSFIIPRPVPDCEVRAFKYLVKGFPEMDFDFVSDTDAVKSDIPVLALGSGGSNYCTDQIMMAIGFAGTGSGRPSAYDILNAAPKSTGASFDYGVIARTTSNGRLGIACWGLHTTGTAGAAWFLANRFKDIRKALEWDYDSDFVAVLKFPQGQETQGQLVHVYRRDEVSNFTVGL